MSDPVLEARITTLLRRFILTAPPFKLWDVCKHLRSILQNDDAFFRLAPSIALEHLIRTHSIAAPHSPDHMLVNLCKASPSSLGANTSSHSSGTAVLLTEYNHLATLMSRTFAGCATKLFGSIAEDDVVDVKRGGRDAIDDSIIMSQKLESFVDKLLSVVLTEENFGWELEHEFEIRSFYFLFLDVPLSGTGSDETGKKGGGKSLSYVLVHPFRDGQMLARIPLFSSYSVSSTMVGKEIQSLCESDSSFKLCMDMLQLLEQSWESSYSKAAFGGAAVTPLQLLLREHTEKYFATNNPFNTMMMMPTQDNIGASATSSSLGDGGGDGGKVVGFQDTEGRSRQQRSKGGEVASIGGKREKFGVSCAALFFDPVKTMLTGSKTKGNNTEGNFSVEIILCITSEKRTLGWTGRWKEELRVQIPTVPSSADADASTLIFSLSSSPITIEGNIENYIFSFEDANVHMKTKHTISSQSVDGSSTKGGEDNSLDTGSDPLFFTRFSAAKGTLEQQQIKVKLPTAKRVFKNVLRKLRKEESGLQEEIERECNELGNQAIKKLRRKLPVTRQLFDFSAENNCIRRVQMLTAQEAKE